jgi:hypothetical protein
MHDEQTSTEAYFHELATELAQSLSAQGEVERGEFFGYPALTVAGKTFVVLHDESLAFKLSEEQYRAAMALPETVLWDPSGKHRPMVGWVQVPSSGRVYWGGLMRSAMQYVRSTNGG